MSKLINFSIRIKKIFSRKYNDFWSAFESEFLKLNKGFNLENKSGKVIVSGKNDPSKVIFSYVNNDDESLNVNIITISAIPQLITNVLTAVYDAAQNSEYGFVHYICKDCNKIEQDYFNGQFMKSMKDSDRTLFDLKLN